MALNVKLTATNQNVSSAYFPQIFIIPNQMCPKNNGNVQNVKSYFFFGFVHFHYESILYNGVKMALKTNGHSLQKYCGEYVKWVEEALAEALTTYQKPTDEDGGYVRQSSVKYVK